MSLYLTPLSVLIYYGISLFCNRNSPIHINQLNSSERGGQMRTFFFDAIILAVILSVVASCATYREGIRLLTENSVESTYCSQYIPAQAREETKRSVTKKAILQASEFFGMLVDFYWEEVIGLVESNNISRVQIKTRQDAKERELRITRLEYPKDEPKEICARVVVKSLDYRDVLDLYPESLSSMEIPRFPWPPPAASSFMKVPLRGLKEFIKLKKVHNGLLLFHIEQLLRNALESAGYREVSIYLVPDGFAIVSQFEQIKEDGSPMSTPARWGKRVNKISHFTLKTYLRALFTAPPGYYRIIVFIVTPHPFIQSSKSFSRYDAENLVKSGSNVLPNDIARQPFTDQFVCTALIYEFEKFDTEKESIFRRPGRLDAQTHITKSGIWENLL